MRRCLIIFLSFLLVFTVSINVFAEEGSKVILIDPGHGGFDGGAKSKSGTIEKEINLEISLKLKEALLDKGYIVYLTREDDEGLYEKGTTIREKKRSDLKRRTELKRETNCDIFISIHQNMFPQTKVYGAQVWYASNEKSALLAKSIQDTLKSTIDDNNKRVAKAAGEAYLILRDKYEGASILVECGFLSNPEEENRLKSEEHQELLINAISRGIDEFFNQSMENNGVL